MMKHADKFRKITSKREPTVSVVMAVRNQKCFLERAIESVLGQSFQDFEFIIVDDASSDGSDDIARKYGLLDSRIVLVQGREHNGLIAALNLGCRIASGQYIARIDADDVATQTRFHQQIAYFHANPGAGLLGGSTRCIDSNGVPLFIMRWPTISQGLRDYLLIDCAIAHTTVMFKRDIFLSRGGYRPSYESAEDYDLFLRLSDFAEVDNLPTILCEYRLHPEQASMARAYQQVLSSIGARLATQARRMNRPEPRWTTTPVAADDLIALGVRQCRIDDLVSEYGSQITKGWRWSKSRFCELPDNRAKFL